MQNAFTKDPSPTQPISLLLSSFIVLSAQNLDFTPCRLNSVQVLTRLACGDWPVASRWQPRLHRVTAPACGCVPRATALLSGRQPRPPTSPSVRSSSRRSRMPRSLARSLGRPGWLAGWLAGWLWSRLGPFLGWLERSRPRTRGRRGRQRGGRSKVQEGDAGRGGEGSRAPGLAAAARGGAGAGAARRAALRSVCSMPWTRGAWWVRAHSLVRFHVLVLG